MIPLKIPYMNFDKKLLLLVLLPALFTGCGQKAPRHPGNLRLLYWNIQNGMWDGQDDNYDRFTAWVEAQDADVCVWCEAQPIFKAGSTEKLDDIAAWRTDDTLTAWWKEMAARYGHRYVFLGGHRDNYPQVVTSRFPIEGVDRLIGNGADSIVSHGAGWARIQVADRPVNIVTLHTWPQAYGLNVPVEDRERSKAAHEGDRYRRLEMEYICRHTILTADRPDEEYWMMMGDFNSMSRRYNWIHHFADDDTRLLVHDYVNGETPYIDIIAEREPDNSYSSTGGKARIDFVYATRALYDCVLDAWVVTDDYTRPIRDPQQLSNFWRPSDHRPIRIDFDIQ